MPIAIVAVLAGLMSLPASAGAVPGLDRKPVVDVVPGEAIVRFESGADATERLAARRAAGVDFERALAVERAQLVEVDGGVEAAVERLEAQPGVKYAQPNYRYQALATAPDDTFFGDLWGLAATPPGISALGAWVWTRGDGQVIAIVDTGVDLDHPDLQGNLWVGPGGIHGRDFVDGDLDPDDYAFHGTHVAGTAAAIAGNGIGAAGVAPQAQIMAVRVLDGNGSGTTDDIGAGISYAAQNGADVINLSLGAPGASDSFLSNAVNVADQHDAVVVAAAGNDGVDNDFDPHVPCVLPHDNLICVAAMNQAGNLTTFSNVGATTVDVGAPGANVLSAKTDYGTIFSEGFETGLTAWSTPTGSTAWGTSSVAATGGLSATDSTGGDYAANADAQMVKTVGLDLTGRRGCRMHFDALYTIEHDNDELIAGAVHEDLGQATKSYSGLSGGAFVAQQASISPLDGADDVFPAFGLFSNGTVQTDGAYVDDLDVLCRDATYADSKAESGNYVVLRGTSMAAPHVAGIAALVGTAAPELSNVETIAAIKSGGTPSAALAGATTSGRAASAYGAVASALGLPTSAPVVAPKPVPTGLPRPMPPKPADLSRARARIRVSRGGAFRYAFRATTSLTGRASFKTRRKAVVSRKAHVTIGSRRFTVGPSGRVTVKIVLSKRKLAILRRNGRLLLKVRVKLVTLAGLSSSAARNLTLVPPKRR